MEFKRLFWGTIFLCTQTSWASDPNFIQPEDLPKTAIQAWSISRRRADPQVVKSDAIKYALKANLAQQICKSEVGEQISSWVEETTNDGFYSRYTISARFSCKEPKTRTIVSGKVAEIIDRAIRDEHSNNQNTGKLLCYHFYRPVCIDGTSLLRYNSVFKCEINRLGAQSLVLEDLYGKNVDGHSGALRDEGAKALMTSLPVYIDGRRDDDQIGTPLCGPHKFGVLKGLYRKSLEAHCWKDQGVAFCEVQGILK